MKYPERKDLHRRVLYRIVPREMRPSVYKDIPHKRGTLAQALSEAKGTGMKLVYENDIYFHLNPDTP
jgi:hypothetical protein